LQPWSSSQTLTENIAKCDESAFRLRLIEVKESDLPFQEALLLNIIQYFFKEILLPKGIQERIYRAIFIFYSIFRLASCLNASSFLLILMVSYCQP